MTQSIHIKQAETKDELEQILRLQNENHAHSLTQENKKLNGFVTVKHDIEILTKMNSVAPQIIAKDNDVVVGYALVMLKEFREMVPALIPMFEMFDTISFQQRKITDYKFYVMGQICIAEAYRGQGIFEQLYLKHKEIYADKFEILLTEVSVNNIRSMNAHLNIGFQTISTYKDEIEHWNILLWDWGKNK